MTDPKQSQESHEDLEPTDENAEQVTGGDTAGTTPVSNIAKTGHDTAMNSINNIR